MKKTFSAAIYFFIAAILINNGLIVKYFLVDNDLGARFKNFNHPLLVSNILFIYALFLGIIGLIFHAIRKNKKSTLKDSTVIVSGLLIIPISLVLVLTPILQTIYPGEVGDSKMDSWLIGLTSIGTLAAFAWIIMLPVTFIKQTFIILTSKGKKSQPTLFKDDIQSTIMKQYKIKENGFKEMRKRILIWAIPMVFISGTVGLIISEYSSSYNINPDINVLPYLIPMILGTFAFGIIKAINRQKAIYESYELKIDDRSITRIQANTPTIRILFTEISRITKSTHGGFVITGNKLANLIMVPAQIEDLEDLENILKANCNLTISSSKPIIQHLTIPLIFLVLGLMATTYISTNKIFVSISGIILIGIMIFSFIKIQTNKNVDSKTRKSSYWVIVVILSLVVIIASKLMN